MTKEELKSAFYPALVKAFTDIEPIPYNDSYGARIGYAMMFMLNKTLITSSVLANIILDKEGKMIEEPIDNRQGLKKAFEEKQNKYTNEIDLQKTIKALTEYLDNNGFIYFIHRNFYNYFFIMEDMAISLNNDGGRTYIYIVSETGETPEWFEALLRFTEKEKDNTYQYVVRSSHGFTTKKLEVNDLKVDLNLNYNDDIPDEQIKDFLMSDNAGVVILHGEPGTGKSTYIRHLISKLDKNFLYLDGSCFDHLTDATFIELLFQNKGAVVILEDAEKLLRKRTDSISNNQVSPLLNLTDGLLGDSMKLKVICTFNAPLEKIDDAILRKGRLKVKYLFNKLNKEKTAKLLDKLGIHSTEEKEQTLADIYNYAEVVDFGEKKRRSVGF